MVQVSNPSKDNRFFYSPQHPEWLWGPSSLFNEHQGPLHGVKQSRHEFTHTSPSNVKVKNDWIYTSPPPTCIHYVSMESFTFTNNIPISNIPATTIAPAVTEQPNYFKQQTYV